MIDLNSGALIAVVDDEKEIVNMLTEALRSRGMRPCFVAYDGDEAVLKFAKCSPRPDIVLMDYRMPIMDGLQAMKGMLQIMPEARIIFLSADADIEEEALRAGATAFLKKPARIGDIFRAIRTATGSNA